MSPVIGDKNEIAMAKLLKARSARWAIVRLLQARWKACQLIAAERGELPEEQSVEEESKFKAQRRLR